MPFRSVIEAAGSALRELEKKLPETATDNASEWGTLIVRADDPNGGYNYYYHPITESSGVREWKATLRAPNGSIEWAICHTHPNDTGFSSGDKDIAQGKKFFSKMKIFMVTFSGAYWYDGTYGEEIGRNSHLRFGTLWGDTYPWAFHQSTEKLLK
jgi:hypothetical protein